MPVSVETETISPNSASDAPSEAAKIGSKGRLAHLIGTANN